MGQEKRSRIGWQGYLPAITTPFTTDLQLDRPGLGRLLEWLHAEGMHGLVLAGTTGEWTSLSSDERGALFRAAGAQMRGKLPLIAGCGSLTARESIALAHLAHEAGFEGILLTPPPYVRPNDDEIVDFYATVAADCRLPICVYNWPPGTGVDMSLSLLERLADIDAVVAIKQSTPRFDRFAETFFALRDRVRVFGFPMNELGLTLLQVHGGDGTMGAGGVLGRIQPDFYNQLWAGDIAAARACGTKDRVLMTEWFGPDLVGRFGSGPAILKAALDARGVPGGPVRPPLRNVATADSARVADTLGRLGVIPVGAAGVASTS